MESRLATLRNQLNDAQVDGILVVNPVNRRYLSGFDGSAGMLLIDQNRSLLVTDGRYTVQAANQSPEFTVVTRGMNETLNAALANHTNGIKRLGYEPTVLTVNDFNALREVLPDVEWVDVSGLVGQSRMIKDADEMHKMRRAIAITDQAFARVRSMLRPTMRERDVAWELHKAIIELGADDLAFDIIVGAGLNSALPHYHAGEALLGRGQPIVIDVGAAYKGYHADMTRTVILGESNERFGEIYGIVHNALQKVTSGIHAGITGSEADALARNFIAEAGYGEFFSHSTGHGVGLFIHEEPRLSGVNPLPLPAKSIFTIEPGIYLPDWGGVRLENIVYFDGASVETITTTPFEPVVEID